MPYLKRSTWDGCILFIEQCSVIASKLFRLTVSPMGQRWKRGKKFMTKRPVTTEDWADDCSQALRCLKQVLIDCILLAHPDFNRPF